MPSSYPAAVRRQVVDCDPRAPLSLHPPVTVYEMLSKGSLDEKKWEPSSAKADGSDLALDGQTMGAHEEPVSLDKVLKELRARGALVTGEEVA